MPISKELLSEVLGCKLDIDEQLQPNEIEYIEKVGSRLYYRYINIYELANKCKEWAYTKNYFLFSGHGAISASCEVNHRTASPGKINPQEIVLADTESEAVFEACQWILENKEN
jgi:hypothetical protein